MRRGMGQKGVDKETVLDPDGQRMGQFVAVAVVYLIPSKRL